MKNLFLFLGVLFTLNILSQTSTPKLYININSHNEMTATEPYDTAPTYTFYHQTKDTLRKIVDMIYSKNAKYDLQTCQKFVLGCLHAEAAATSTTDILEYAYKLGGLPYGRFVQIDPRSKTQAIGNYTYNIADVAHLIDSTGAKASKVVGGFIYYNSTVTATASYSVGDWIPYTAPINGTFGQPAWKADILWGAGSLPPHTHDANNFGTWKPRGKTDSLDFYCHDPAQTLWLQGNGCAWNIDATSNIQTIISEIRTEATKIANGTYPSNKFYNASVMFNFKDFQTINTRALLAEIIDSINVMVAQNKIVWATINQKQDSFNVWSGINSIQYSQWKCGQTATLAPTCNLASVNEWIEEDGIIKVFPNPASTELNYELSSIQNKNCYLFVYDNLGREVIKQLINEPFGKISVDNLSSGIYLINITGVRPKKLIITR